MWPASPYVLLASKHLQSISSLQTRRKKKLGFGDFCKKRRVYLPTQLCFFCVCRLLVLAVTSYDIHRSIKSNEIPPTEAQVEALTAQIEDAKHSSNRQ